MIEPTEKGIPPKIEREWFRTRYGQNFPDLLAEDKNDFLDTCIDDTYALFKGVSDIWKHQPRIDYINKTQLCYGLLVAWYITDVFPTYAVGVVSSGGVPVKMKSIGGTKIQFAEQSSASGSYADLLSSLKSNSFGVKAYFMIKTSGKVNLFIQR